MNDRSGTLPYSARPQGALVGHSIVTDAKRVQQILKNLLSNAFKFTAQGEVTRAAGSNWITLVWGESGGPQVRNNPKNGFGLSVIRAACNKLGAETEHLFTPVGVRFSLSGPLEQTGKPRIALAASDKSESPEDEEFPDEFRCRILVVEDEVLVAMQVKEDMESSGHVVIGPAQSVAQGIALVDREQIDFAFLDLQLGDELSIPVAEHLSKLGVPFAFTTGFDDHSILPKHFHQVPSLTKPYAIGGLSRFILNYFNRRADGDRTAERRATSSEPTIH